MLKKKQTQNKQTKKKTQGELGTCRSIGGRVEKVRRSGRRQLGEGGEGLMKREGSRHSPVNMHKCSQGKAKKGRNREAKRVGAKEEGGERGDAGRFSTQS